MGRLTFTELSKADFDDRLLAHLQIVIGAKLRRGEPFYFTWTDDSSIGDGRSSIWLHPRSDLLFKYYGSRPPIINAAWIDALSYTANSARGLYIIPEPEQRGQTGTA